GAPFGGTTVAGQNGLESFESKLIVPPNGAAGGGRYFPSIVVVALGEPEAPVVCWASAEPTVRTATNEADKKNQTAIVDGMDAQDFCMIVFPTRASSLRRRSVRAVPYDLTRRTFRQSAETLRHSRKSLGKRGSRLAGSSMSVWLITQAPRRLRSRGPLAACYPHTRLYGRIRP